jgi:3-methyladenine DNA glycosylase Tag
VGSREVLTLEAFQSGLSGDADIERLLGDPSIVRHRGKVEATVTNARAVRRPRDDGSSLVDQGDRGYVTTTLAIVVSDW